MKLLKFIGILVETRDKILKEMKHGFWRNGVLSHDPTIYDINNGHCDEFAGRVCEKVRSANEVTFEGCHHMWIEWNGKFYDAECIGGVTDFMDLSFFLRLPQVEKDAIRAKYNTKAPLDGWVDPNPNQAFGVIPRTEMSPDSK